MKILYQAIYTLTFLLLVIMAILNYFNIGEALSIQSTILQTAAYLASIYLFYNLSKEKTDD